MRNLKNPHFEKWKVFIPPEELYYRYIKQRWSIQTIANYYKCDGDVIFSELKIFEIPRRSTTEVLKGRKCPQSHCDNISRAQLGGKRSEQTKNKMRESALKIPKETRDKMHEELLNAIAGPKHWNWKGGKPRRPHCGYYINKWRKYIFERDNFCCSICGQKGYLEAHHIFPYSDYPLLAFNLTNGITLCKSCHNKTKGKEYTYVEYFINKLNSFCQGII